MAQIKTFARLKPTKKPYNGYVISKNVLTMHIPDNKDFVILGPQSNYRSNFSYDILFTNIFGCDATQEEVFDGVAKDIIQNFLNGYNGTIFAYGQTGTGKTYTVEGNTNRYSARGLATRALSMIYQELEKRSDQHISVYLSYLEIYQEVAYDLLNPAARSTIPIAPFARVTVVEGPRGSCILRGLSLHLAANEEIAQMLLLQGQANRKVAETPVNQRSSRSHAVFTVYLQVRKHDSDVLVNSKLHLVDLAGSERVSKTGVDGQQLTEAKSINLSLHHLETVIIALQLDKPTSASCKAENPPPQQSRSNSSLMSSGPSSDNGGSRQLRFVPYRNSLLTMVLKDSLGGNCLTAMIATISLEPENLGESISTCRFAQRVARIANNARRNEEVDDKALIKRLKNKVAYLENQVALLRSKGRSDPVTDEEIMNVLTDEDHRICERIMEGFLQGVITDPIEAGISDHCRFRACLHLLKHQFLHRSLTSPSLGGQSTPTAAGMPGGSGTAVIPGSSTSTSTLLPRPSCSGVDVLGAVCSANNPQRDSGDYATAGQGLRQSLSENPKRSEGLFDSREKHSFDGYDVRNSKQLGENLLVSKGVQGGQGEEMTGLHSSDCASAGDMDGGEHRKNAFTKAKGKKGTNNLSGIDEVLQACSSSGSGGPGEQRYKSPYERKREKEIRRLSRKLYEMEEDKAGRENHLQQMKDEAIVEELLVAETGLRLKLQVAEEQVADQHAYLLQLKHLQADPDLVTKEQLVEKQLRKRQAKFHEKLCKVLASKDALEKDFAQRQAAGGTDGSQQQLQQPACRESSSKTSLEERFGQYKQGKGALNTRQVFDLLKNEEKKQHKESQKVERETTMVKTKQLAIKEAATLEKLRELKQMLKLSLLKEEQEHQQDEEMGRQVGQNLSSSCKIGDNSVSSERHDGVGRAHGPLYSSNGITALHKEGGGGTHTGHSSSLSSSAGSHRQVNNRPQHQQLKAWVSSDNQNQSQHCSMSVEQSRSVHQFMVEMLGGQASHNGVGSHSHSDFAMHHRQQQQQPTPSVSISYTSTLVDEASSHGNQSFAGFSVAGKASSATTTASKSVHDPRHSLKFFQNDHKDHTLSTSTADDTFSGIERPVRFANSKEFCKAATGLNIDTNSNNVAAVGVDGNEDEELLISDLEAVPVSHSTESFEELGGDKSTTACQSATQLSQFQNGVAELPLSQNPADHQSSPPSSLLALQRMQLEKGAGPVVPPSEYINSMSSQDKFDARRMGLSSRTFESALSHMLDTDESGRDTAGAVRNAPDLPYSVDPYQEFTRSSRPSQPGRQNFSLLQSPYLQKTSQHRAYRSSRQHGKLSSSPSHSPTREFRASKEPRTAMGNNVHAFVPSSSWGPESKNASVADRLSNFLDVQASNDTSLHNPNKKTLDLDPFETKLAKFKSEAYSNQSSVDDVIDMDGANVNYEKEDCEEDEEDRSFFGLQPAETKLTALSSEESEKTFMSTVAAEKARVEKIRRARNAAEVIQRRWRKFRARQ